MFVQNTAREENIGANKFSFHNELSTKLQRRRELLSIAGIHLRPRIV
jgi:hypothetical protein